MTSHVRAGTVIGLQGQLIDVEADITSTTLPSFVIVGLPDTAVQESRERIRSAIKNSGFKFPPARIAVNLAPADLKKQGPSFDVSIALALLLASGQLKNEKVLSEYLIIGELSLSGDIRPVQGVLPMVLGARERGLRKVIVPLENVREASVVENMNIFGVSSLTQAAGFLCGRLAIAPAPVYKFSELQGRVAVDFRDIKGQEAVKRALEIAAAGGHNIAMSGPPGSGKTLLARSLVGILPPLSLNESLEVTKIFSVAGLLDSDVPLVVTRPFRTPHHTASAVALIGGGSSIRPGEISLAHRGMLFLDEFPEFPRTVLDSLRQPLEDGIVTVSRAQGTVQFPAKFILVAAMNPCPCGYATDPDRPCVCNPSQIIKYQKKISGPLLDRIDLHIEVPRIAYEKLTAAEAQENSATVARRVKAAREAQTRRFANTSLYVNAEMGLTELAKFCQLGSKAQDLMKQAVNRLLLSARSYHRLLKVARTIADLEGSPHIEVKHVAESLQYRPKIRSI